MLPTQLTYPVFAANQVLASDHLNQLFNRLDEQNRLTRANLIGIGIVCGLEPTIVDLGGGNVRVRISTGVGVTSEGYLMTVNEDPDQIADDYEWYRPYTTPENIAYREFEELTPVGVRPFPMWELTRDRNDDDESQRITSNFLRGVNQPVGRREEKILVLFLECLEESNRNCSPNSCSDKGNTVTASVKPLLIRRSDIDILQARIRNLGPEVDAYFSLTDTMNSRLGLPTLRMPRFDVIATNLNGTTSIMTAFQRVLNQPLVDKVANAFSAAYDAFAPVLNSYDANPFADLVNRLAFLHDGSIETDNLYLHYQYYYDHLEILMHAYEEFRAQGLEILGLCNPDGRLFRRHLFLANLGQTPPSYDYRHSFVPSPLFTRATGSTDELRSLFERLVLLVNDLELPPRVGNLVGNTPNFTLVDSLRQPTILTRNPLANLNLVGAAVTTTGSDAPTTTLRPNDLTALRRAPATTVTAATNLSMATRLPANRNFFATNLNNFFAIDADYRRTFYRPRLTTDITITPSRLGGTLSNKAIPYHYRPSPLYRYWNYQLSQQGKARENLGYRNSSWNGTDDFVRNPLNYDLEQHDFLRIEGHIGQNFSVVLSELLTQRRRYRLPIDIVALKTGANADNVRLQKVADCHFQDLETLYDAFRHELLCQIIETIKRFYNVPIISDRQSQAGARNQVPQLPELVRLAPNFRYATGTVGGHYEAHLNLHNDQFPHRGDLPIPFYYYSLFINQLVQLARQLSASLSGLNMENFRQRYEQMTNLMSILNDLLLQETNAEGQPLVDNLLRGVDEDEFSDQLDLILYACKLESFQAIYDEYEARREKMRERLLLVNFARQHPGLQHKAGVPPGGTFVMVYHGEDQPDDLPVRNGGTVRGRIVTDGEAVIGASILIAGTSSGTVTDFDGNFSIDVPQFPATLIASFVGFEPREILVNSFSLGTIDLNDPPPANTFGRFAELAVGTVFADFYLPYLCCSDCAPVQFVLPKEPPTFSWEQMGCTNPNNGGQIMILPSGGTPPYDYSRDGGLTWNPLSEGRIDVNDGDQLSIRDAEGTISVRRTVDLRPPFIVQRIDDGGECADDGQSYQVRFRATGGQAPYRVRYGDTEATFGANQDILARFPSGTGGTVLIADNSDPACEQRFEIAEVVCEQPNVCDLPSGGATVTASYPFWMQRNYGDLEYFGVELQVEQFTITNNQTLQRVDFNDDQREELSGRLSPAADLPTVSTFTQRWREGIAKANDYLNEQLNEFFGSENEAVLALQYVANIQGGLTGLRITHYEGFSFSFRFTLRFRTISEKYEYERFWEYSEERCGVKENFQRGNVTASSGGEIFAFQRERFNRCNPDEPSKFDCEDNLNFRIVTDPLDDPIWQVNRVNLNDLPVMWFSEAGISGISGEPALEVILEFPRTYQIRALVVDPTSGCAGVARVNINRTDSN